MTTETEEQKAFCLVTNEDFLSLYISDRYMGTTVPTLSHFVDLILSCQSHSFLFYFEIQLCVRSLTLSDYLCLP